MYTGVSLTFSAGEQLVFTGRQNVLKLTFLEEEDSSRWSNQAGKIILTATRFVHCPAPNETPNVQVHVVSALCVPTVKSCHSTDVTFTCTSHLCQNLSSKYFKYCQRLSMPIILKIQCVMLFKIESCIYMHNWELWSSMI